MSRSLPLILLAVSTLAAACRRSETGTGESALAEAAVDSSEVGLDEADLLATALDGAPLGVAPATAADVAIYIAGRVPGQYTPPGCVTTTTSGATVTAVFAGCTGPFGMISVDGTVTFVVQPSTSGAITVDATADGFVSGDAVLDLDATAVYRTAGGSSSLAVTTRTAATGALGHELQHAGDYTVIWDATCASIDGAWSTSLEDRSRSTTASVERCRAACPTGAVTRTTVDGRTISIAFDGTSRATWTSSAGRSGSIALPCSN